MSKNINVTPQIYWNIWRRIMREETLQNIIFDDDFKVEKLNSFDFSKEEFQAVLDYQKKAKRASWFVLNYRYRLVNSVLNALETGGAPLTLRALFAMNSDIKEFSKEFLDTVSWKDYGPNVYTYCKDVLTYLLKDETLSSQVKDLIYLEKEVVKLMLNYEDSKVSNDENANYLYKTKKARCYKSMYKLSDWLKNKKAIAKTNLESKNENFLVYLPNIESSHKFVIIPQRAMDIYLNLDEGLNLKTDLSNRLVNSGKEKLTKEDDKFINILLSYNAVGTK